MKVKTYIILLVLLLIPTKVIALRRIKRPTVDTLCRALVRNQIITRQESRQIRQSYRTKLKQGGEMTKKDIIDAVLEAIQYDRGYPKIYL